MRDGRIASHSSGTYTRMSAFRVMTPPHDPLLDRRGIKDVSLAEEGLRATYARFSR